MPNYKSKPTSKKLLTTLSYKFRDEFHISYDEPLPILKIYDLISSEDDKESFSYLIVSDDDSVLDKDKKELAKYVYNENTIYIGESTYAEACMDIGRARFTLTHEFAHYLLLKLKKNNIINIGDGEEIKRYEDPERQADTLAGALLVPYYECLDISIEEIMKKYLVSEECATYYKLKIKNEKNGGKLWQK